MTLRPIRYGLLILFTLFLVGAGVAILKLRSSLPAMDGNFQVAGLQSPVKVTFDSFGIPTLTAETRKEAFLALGYVTAQERLFQMDLMRRHSAGRLAEITGTAALPLDREQRIFGFQDVAKAVVEQLPLEKRQALQAYSQGVNAFLGQMKNPPWEFLAARYRPEPWAPQDSILVAFAMFQQLNRDIRDERMLSVMAATLPAEVTAFLTPDTDHYTQVLVGDLTSHRPLQPIPAGALANLLRTPPAERIIGLVAMEETSVGSNAWAVGASKTGKEGYALLANDMHLPLSVPNIWYQATLQYDNLTVSGITLPGIPLVIAGSNPHLAWGFTNGLADLLDLVSLEVNSDQPDQYQTPQGWKSFGSRTETVQVKGAPTVELEVKTTIWGPVAEKPLLGRPVAIHWTALDPRTTSLDLLDMDTARTVEDGIRIMNQAGGPLQNGLLADETGRIAWTYMGKLPIRTGFDGAISRSWAEGNIGWAGYVAPAELPHVLDPPSSFLVSANNRALGKDYPYVIGHNFASGYRTYHIQQRLQAITTITEEAMLELQLDTHTQFYDFYQKLAMQVLESFELTPWLAEVHRYLEAWDGKAETESLGLALLVAFRNSLADAVFTPFLAACKKRDPDFVYSWLKLDAPLRRLLTEQIPETLPDPDHYSSWQDFIRAQLLQSAHQLKETHHVKQLQELTWGQLNKVSIDHPFSKIIPGVVGKLVNMDKEALPGCLFCVRLIHGINGASERMVVSPSRLGQAILHMPGGQSGHPLSRHYRDQHPYWINGLPLPFLPKRSKHELTLHP